MDFVVRRWSSPEPPQSRLMTPTISLPALLDGWKSRGVELHASLLVGFSRGAARSESPLLRQSSGSQAALRGFSLRHAHHQRYRQFHPGTFPDLDDGTS